MKWKIHKRELDSLSRGLGQRMARWLTRLPVILQRQDKQLICNNCNTSYVDTCNIKILPIQRQAGTLANDCVQPSMVSQEFLSNILLYTINTCGILVYKKKSWGGFSFTLTLFGFMGVRDIINNTQWAYCSLLVFCHHRKPPKSNCNCKSSLDSALYWIH